MTPPRDLGFAHRFEPGTAAGAPFLLLLHGTGGDENSLIPLGRAIAPGAALLSPRGQVMEQGMARFFRRLADIGDFDQEDLEVRTKDLAHFLVLACSAYSIPRGKLVAVGFSNGATIAASLILRFPEELAGAALMRGMVPFVPKAVDIQRRSVLLLGGVDDPIVGTDEVAELANIFRAANAEVTLHWETAGHTLSQGDVLMAFDWMRKFFAIQRSGARK